VYGAKWLEVIAPLQILVVSGFFFNILFPCARLLDARNLLSQEMVVLVVRLVVVTLGCVLGLRWGLKGVAWGILISHVFASSSLYYLVCRAIRTNVSDLIRAITPAFILNSMLFFFLTTIDFLFRHYELGSQVYYLVAMTALGAVFYGVAFLVIPIPSTQSETDRWRSRINGGVRLAYKAISR